MKSPELSENIQHFLNQDSDWQAAESHLIGRRNTFIQTSPPGAAELAQSAGFEVAAWQALWQGEIDRGHGVRAAGDRHLGQGRGPRRYAALWNYLLGSWAAIAAKRTGDPAQLDVTRAAFIDARAGARGTTWLSHMASSADAEAMTGAVTPDVDPLDASAIEQVALRLEAWRRPGAFDSVAAEIVRGLSQTEHRAFEGALVKLGELAGANESVGNNSASAAPDACWAFNSIVWVAWEAKSEAIPEGQVHVDPVRQTNGHLLSMSDQRRDAIPSGSLSVLTTPQVGVDPTAAALAQYHLRVVGLDFPMELAVQLERAWRTIRTSVAPSTEPEHVNRLIHEALKANSCLPTQWTERLNTHRFRAPESE